MSFEETLRMKAQQVGEILSVQNLPESLELQVVQEEYKTDKQGKECLFMRLKTKDGKLVVQKYTSSTYKDLEQAITRCGGYQNLKDDFHTWTKQHSGKTINQRLFPTPKTSKKK